MRLLDVRCDGVRTSGPLKGSQCRNLLCRRDVAMSGSVETKCPRCNKVRLWTFGVELLERAGVGPLVAVST